MVWPHFLQNVASPRLGSPHLGQAVLRRAPQWSQKIASKEFSDWHSVQIITGNQSQLGRIVPNSFKPGLSAQGREQAVYSTRLWQKQVRLLQPVRLADTCHSMRRLLAQLGQSRFRLR